MCFRPLLLVAAVLAAAPAPAQQSAGTAPRTASARTPAPTPSMADVPPPRLFRGLRLPAAVKSEQPMILEVVDDLNRPVPGARVTVVPDTGCGRVATDTSRTDAAGRIPLVWTMGTRAGVCTAVARVVGSKRFPRVLTVVTTNGPGEVITLVRGGNQRAKFGALLPDFLEILVKDRYGNVARNAHIRFVVVSGGGRIVDYAAVPALTRSTNLRGYARIVWRLGPGGPQRLEARPLDAPGTKPFVIEAQGIP